MSNLFTDPVKWSGAAVSTWPRFWFMAVMLSALTAFVIFQAVDSGWRAAGGLAVLLVIYHLMFLYAMRRMYLLLQTKGNSPNGAA